MGAARNDTLLHEVADARSRGVAENGCAIAAAAEFVAPRHDRFVVQSK